MVVERAMFAFLTKFLLIVRSRLRSQARLQAEILVLRQQLLVLSRKSLLRARLRNLDRLILVWLYRLFPSILDAYHSGEAPLAAPRLSSLLALEVSAGRWPTQD